MGWFKRNAQLVETTSLVSQLIGQRAYLGTEQTITSIGSVFRAISVLSTVTASLPLGTYAGDVHTGPFRGLAEQHTDREFVAATVASLAGWGEAFWLHPPQSQKYRGWRYRQLVHPSQVQWDDKRQMWAVSLETGVLLAHPSWRSRLLVGPADVMLTHLRHTVVPGQRRGVGPLGAARRAAGMADELLTYAETAYSSSGIPSGVLETEQVLPADQPEKIKARWQEAHSGAGRSIAVLSGGLRYKPFILSPTDADFVRTSDLSDAWIMRCFGIPPKLGYYTLMGDSSTYSNSESDWRQFLTATLSAYTDSIRDALTDDRGHRIDFVLTGLLRADFAARVMAYAQAGDWLTPDEIRGFEGLPPLGQPVAETDTGVIG